jgi:dienelactone hydrolase
MRRALPSVLACFAWALAAPALAAQSSPRYDPLRVDGAGAPAPLDLDVVDERRSRTIPIRVYRPRDARPAPVVLFSHGLGGARTNNAYLWEHGAARGYVVVHLQHPGSDEGVWQGARPLRRLAALRRAANARNLVLRAEDVPAVLDALEAWNAAPGHPLAGALDLSRVGMSGHSFGAVTTQAVAGQAVAGQAVAGQAVAGQAVAGHSGPDGRTPFLDARIGAAVLMSPSVPRNVTAEAAFGRVSLPWLLMTGTRDGSPIGNTTVADRLAVYPALPPGNTFELVLHDAEHSAFGDRALPGERAGRRNPNHHRAILALSTAFWDAYLRGDATALTWLRSDAARSVLEPEDRWQWK